MPPRDPARIRAALQEAVAQGRTVQPVLVSQATQLLGDQWIIL